MRTEITIPFAFDTTPIETMMQDHGVEEAMKILRELVEKNAISQIPKMRDRYYYVNNHYVNNGNDPDWKGYMDDIARKLAGRARSRNRGRSGAVARCKGRTQKGMA